MCVECAFYLCPHRLVGRGEFRDAAGHVWMGEFQGETANNLRLKLS